MQKKYIFILVSFVLFLSFIFIFLIQKKPVVKPSPSVEKKIQIVATFYPLQYLATQIGKDSVEVINLTPSGGEPHDYEPTPQDVLKIERADVFVFNGAHFEIWAEKLLSQISSKRLHILNMSVILSEIDTDPHFWLDPILFSKEAEAVRDMFISLNPNQKEMYTKNTENLIFEFKNLESVYTKELSKCVHNEIVSSHDAFHYLAKRFGFTVLPLAGISPSQDPTPKHIAELAKYVKEKNIRYVFTETLTNQKFANTLASELNIKTLVLNPIEGLTKSDLDQNKDYISIMKENLQNLRMALECE